MSGTSGHYALLALLASLALTAASQVQAQAPPRDTAEASLQVITVIGVTPYGDADLSAKDIASAAQSASGEQIERSHAADLTAFLNRQLAGVTLNERQGNPLQPDLSYRGYTASPLLGTPQGLSVYMDGLRLNQPFGDVVSWDLIPRAAIQRIELVSGSSPLFGGNSLGGALSIRTKDGYSAPGTAVELSYGSFGRQHLEVESGGHASNGLYWYFTANRFRETGWRDDSPSQAQQQFGKLGWRGDTTDIALTASGATSDLNGNGLQDAGLLAANYASVYTKPDNTNNRSGLLNLMARQQLAEGVRLSGNAWYRNIRTSTFNGDVNGDALGQNLYQPTAPEQAALLEAGYSGFPASGEDQGNTPFPRWRCVANALLNTEPNEQCNGLINRSELSQHNAGAALQLLVEGQWLGRANHFVVGAVHDASSEHFLQSAQFGYLTPDRAVTSVASASGAPIFADGTQGSESAFDARVDLGGRTHTDSVFLADSLAMTQQLRINVAARYDRTTVSNRDALNPGGGPGSLDTDQRFGRVNPSLGLVMAATPALSLYTSYGESSRAPSSIELGCADPANPCRLPNAMAGDPPLSQVLTRTVEAGARGESPAGIAWTAALFRADNIDDILFVADNQAGYGYFRNFGRTRRQGLELGASGRAGTLTVAVHYTLLDATYRSSEVVGGTGNSSNDGAGPGFDGNITIHPGDRIPLIPRQLFKASLQWDIAAHWSLDLDLLMSSGGYASGNENNQHAPDGMYYLGPGSSAAYGVLNLGGEWMPNEALTLFVQVGNLLDRHYATASQLGATAFLSNGNFASRPFTGPVIGGERPLLNATFLAPGAPRSLLLGLRYRLNP
jgi:outer membrane receptor protein involved in Fe transport